MNQKEIPTPNRFERALSAIAPAYALNRYKARLAFSYEGARIGRLRDLPPHQPNPETARESYDRIRLMEQVRDLVENLPLAQSMLTKLGNYSLSDLRYQARTPDPQWNKQAEAHLSNWFDNCDISGRFTFADMARIALYSYIRDGDFFWLWRQDEGGIKLQGIEADRVGGNMPKVTEGEASGIIYNKETGRPTAYRIFARNFSGSYTEEQVVTSDSIIPFYDHLRYDQYRGISAFAPAVPCMRDYKELMEAVRIGVKFENYHGGFSYSESGQADDPNDYFSQSTDRTAGGRPVDEFKLQPGTVKHLANTSRVDLIKSERPGQSFQSYSEMLVREILLTADLPSGFGWNLEKLGGPGARMDAAQAYRKIRYIQKSVMAPRMNRAIYAELTRAMASGELAYREDWKAGHWQFPAPPTIDVGRDSAAGINEVRAGLISKADWFAESGKDREEEESEIEREAVSLINRAKAIAETTGFPIERVMDMLDMRIPSGTPSIQLPSEDLGKDMPLISSIGIGGTQALADLVASVSEGGISPLSARALLRSVFGMTPEQAEEIFPVADDAKQRGNPEASVAPAKPEADGPQPTEAEFDASTFRPTAAMAKNAQRALDVRKDKPASQRGMTPVGLSRARDISNRRNLPLETVRRIKAYFDRHAVDKEGATWSEQGKGWQAWNGWGGDEGRTWAEAIVRRADEDDLSAVPSSTLSRPMRKILELAQGIQNADTNTAGITPSEKLAAVHASARRGLEALRTGQRLAHPPGFVPDDVSAEMSARLTTLLQRSSESLTELSTPPAKK